MSYQDPYNVPLTGEHILFVGGPGLLKVPVTEVEVNDHVVTPAAEGYVHAIVASASHVHLNLGRAGTVEVPVSGEIEVTL